MPEGHNTSEHGTAGDGESSPGGNATPKHITAVGLQEEEYPAKNEWNGKFSRKGDFCHWPMACEDGTYSVRAPPDYGYECKEAISSAFLDQGKDRNALQVSGMCRGGSRWPPEALLALLLSTTDRGGGCGRSIKASHRGRYVIGGLLVRAGPRCTRWDQQDLLIRNTNQ